MEIKDYLIKCQSRINKALPTFLPSVKEEPRELHKAMQYAVLNGGKRIRSALIYSVGDELGAKPIILDTACAAMEMIHAFSLIHDDLPAIDNDDLRRGKPTCHKVFGEATAILAGDALQTRAFEIVANIHTKKLAPNAVINMLRLLGQAVGSKGMIGGEEIDIKMVKKKVKVKDLENMYWLKTGCLLSASLQLGAYAADCRSKKVFTNLEKFAQCIGIAFQIHDDIIGIESDTATLGKQQGNDLELGKPVYPVMVGMKKAKAREQALFDDAMKYLKKTGMKTEKLEAVASYIIQRNY